MDNHQLGVLGEEKAIEFLEKKGYHIIEKNFTCKIGEIDIIAKQDQTTVFIEVKWRKDDKKGRPSEAVHYRKQQKIIKVAMLYAKAKGLMETPMRFDIIEIIGNEITIIENAFEVTGHLKYL